ncbi:Cytochrome P450 monooxygenase [Hyphodiscus hymeniophilus]|uniref:Cytochrome P450 monooxygenase n=1 Tax=Hyphodiscus hymeniophilus TaxID=353542 RepID=A0A9P6SPV2_9HELO|nr:Cytochrome P450 monooxygenase [Hyphodiscus hymeniophilus]
MYDLQNSILILASLAYALKYIYRLYFHPLAGFPGPFFAKISPLYSAYHAWKGDIHIDIFKAHEKYGMNQTSGPSIRYAPNRILFNTTAAASDIYGHRKNVTKSTAYESLVHRSPNTFTMRDTKEHSKRRRIIGQCLSETNVRAFEPIILSQAEKLCAYLLQSREFEWSPVLDMSKWCDYHTFDMMSNIIFSADYNTLENNEYKDIMTSIAQSNVRMSVLFQARKVKNFRLDKYFFPQAIAARSIFVKFVVKMIKDRSLKADYPDVFSRLLNSVDPATQERLSASQIAAEATTLIVAGSDTTATALAATFFYLSRNKEAYTQAVKEVRSVFTSKEDIQGGAKLNSCVYLRACITEALRMSPPAGSPPWREVQKGGAMIDGKFIPQGCDVGIGTYSIQHQAQYYPEPFIYKPERWFANSSISDVFNRSFLAFSTGPRGCVGKSLALLELNLTMASLLWDLDFERGLGEVSSGFSCHPDEFMMRDHITAAHEGPYLRFKRRQMQV